MNNCTKKAKIAKQSSAVFHAIKLLAFRLGCLSAAAVLLLSVCGCSDKIDYENLSEVITTAIGNVGEFGSDVNEDGVTLKTAISIACTYVGCSADGISFTYNGFVTIDGTSCQEYSAFSDSADFKFAMDGSSSRVYVDKGNGYKLVSSK